MSDTILITDSQLPDLQEWIDKIAIQIEDASDAAQVGDKDGAAKHLAVAQVFLTAARKIAKR